MYQWKTEASNQCDKEEKQKRSIKKVGLTGKCNSEIEVNLANACHKTWKNIKGNTYLI